MRRFLRRHPFTSLAVAVAVLALGLTACKPAAPTSPNSPTVLTGQNENEQPTFNGTLKIFGGGGRAPADGLTDVAIVVEVFNEDGAPVQNLTPVTFSTSLGTIRASGTDPATAGTAVTVNTWAGQAGALLRSEFSGEAVVSISVADHVRTTRVQFQASASTDVITLGFQSGSGSTSTLEGTTPFLAPIVATVTDETGGGIAGASVRFKILRNSAAGELTAARKTTTDGDGQAFNVLSATQIGTVSLVAELLDANGRRVRESNQIVATVTAESDDFEITLVWADESTTTTAAVPDTVGMQATVVDAATDETLAGRRVRFRIVSDTAETDPAALAETNSTLTNGSGVASNAVTVREVDTVVTIVADLIASDGSFLGSSNQIVIRGEEEEEDEAEAEP